MSLFAALQLLERTGGLPAVTLSHLRILGLHMAEKKHAPCDSEHAGNRGDHT